MRNQRQSASRPSAAYSCGLQGEDLAVEELLQPLVAVVDQQLLEAVVRAKDLEAVQVQQPQLPSRRPGGLGIGGRKAPGYEPREPGEEGRVELLGQGLPQGLPLPLRTRALQPLPPGAHVGLLDREEPGELRLLDTEQRSRARPRLRHGADHGHEPQDLAELLRRTAARQHALAQDLEQLQGARGGRFVEPQGYELQPLRRGLEPAPEGIRPRSAAPGRQGPQRGPASSELRVLPHSR
jgi:hypothetical protein